MFDFLGGGDPPERKVANLDEYSKELLSNAQSDAMKPASAGDAAIDKNYAIGQDTYGKLGGINGAIKDKYGRVLSNQLGRMKDVEKLNSRKEQVDKLKKLQHAVAVKQSVETDAMAAQLEASNMKEAARANALSSILGLGGLAGGYAMAGGFKGSPKMGVPVKDSQISKTYGSGGNQLGGFDNPGMNQSMNYRDNLMGISERSQS